MAAIATIEGIGPSYAAKLKQAGAGSLASLLKAGATKKGRQQLAEATGLSEKLILNWVNKADLARVKGVGGQYGELLEAAGVDTVPELAQRNADNLHAAMVETNAKKKLVRQVPSAKMVADWVAQAKKMDRVVNY